MDPQPTAVAEAVAGVLPAGNIYAKNLSGLGFNALQEDDPARAYLLIRASLDLDPRDRLAWDNLARTLKALNREEEAIAIYRRLIAESPDWDQVKCNLGVSLLRRGEFEEGWRLNRTRLAVIPGLRVIGDPLTGRPLHETPLPSLEAMRGRDVVVVSEQGIGDELCYLRFLPKLWDAAEPRRVWFWPSEKRGEMTIASKIAPVLDRHTSLVRVATDEIIDELRGHGVTLALADLPLVTGMRSYADVPPSLGLAFSRTHWPLRTRNAIGVTWMAGMMELRFKGGLYKNVPPGELGYALRETTQPVVVLQRNLDMGDLAEFEDGLGRPIAEAYDGRGVPAHEELDAWAAALAQLSAYVGVPNTNMHLVAAMGEDAPAMHTLAACLPEYRWADRGDGRSAWFPDAAVYRQDALGWEGALYELSQAFRP